MARLVSTLTARPAASSRTLTPAQRRTAERRLARQQARNPLRRVKLTCNRWVRDPSAVVGDWLFCDQDACNDVLRVVEVAE